MIQTFSTKEKEGRKSLVEAFERAYGTKPMFLCRCPGRVNIIGEHVDYSGFSVLPCCLEHDIIIALHVSSSSSSSSSTLTVRNIKGEEYPPLTITFSPSQPIEIDSSKHLWTNYVLCGVKGALEEMKGAKEGEAKVNKMEGESKVIKMMVDGRVPAGSGLSSSSALVCASVLATLTAYGAHHSIPLKRMASIAISSERFVGIESGGMDQAISFLGKRGCAQLISFDPLANADVFLPSSCVFCVAHTLVTANKYVGSDNNYNLRVVECRMASMLLGKSLGVVDYKHTTRTLRAFLTQTHTRLEDAPTLVAKHLPSGGVGRERVCELLGYGSVEEMDRDLGRGGVVRNNSHFRLLDRARHVYEESLRVNEFQLPSNQDPVILGKLMNESHYSNRDLFEVSCAELEELTTIARSAPGAYGSRLTGAGWGGCTVSLVAADKAEQFLDYVWKRYYEPHEERRNHPRENVLFQTLPADGAYLISL